MSPTGTPVPGPGSPPAGAALPPGLQLPPTFPPGVDPQTYKIDEVTRLLEAADYFPIFNVPNPATPNQPVPVPLPLPAPSPQQLSAGNASGHRRRFDGAAEH
jgi:hypothetical protein